MVSIRAYTGAPFATPSLHHGADDPRRELFLAHAGALALAALAGGHRDDLLEDLAADGGQRRALDDHAAVDIHVLFHVAAHQRVGGQLDGGDRPSNPQRRAAGGVTGPDAAG